MMHVRIFAAAVATLAMAAPAFGDTASPQDMAAMMNMMMAHHPASVTVQSTGEVDYTPDQARVSLGINSEASTATAASADVATRANAVIAALKNLGIPAAQITTTGYNLFHRDAVPNGPAAAYIASNTVNLTTTVDKAGTAIDAGLRAGANQTYGLTYDTSQRDALYRQAVQRAVQAARDIAQAAATAAGAKLGSLASINVGGATPIPIFAPVMRTMATTAAAPPPIEPGTGKMNASVTATYLLSHP